jgi:hypothetical protein
MRVPLSFKVIDKYIRVSFTSDIHSPLNIKLVGTSTGRQSLISFPINKIF